MRIAGRIPDRDPVAQVLAASNHIRELLERVTGKRPLIRSVVLYPGWWVDSRLSHDVWVLNERFFLTLMSDADRPRQIPQEDVKLYSQALATCVRGRELAKS